jgi:hypothetical protein
MNFSEIILLEFGSISPKDFQNRMSTTLTIQQTLILNITRNIKLTKQQISSYGAMKTVIAITDLQIYYAIPYQVLRRCCLVVDTLLITNLPQTQGAHRPSIMWEVRKVWSGAISII